jgi:hypothetical protein
MQEKGLVVNYLSQKDVERLQAIKAEVMQELAAKDPNIAKGIKMRVDYMKSLGK